MTNRAGRIALTHGARSSSRVKMEKKMDLAAVYKQRGIKLEECGIDVINQRCDRHTAQTPIIALALPKGHKWHNDGVAKTKPS